MSSASSTPSQTGDKPAKVTAAIPSAPPEKKVAIVGFTQSRDQAPWGQPGWEVWVCNNLWKLVPTDKWHRVYDLHDLKTIGSDPEQAAFLAGQQMKTVAGEPVALNGRPVVCWEPQEAWPTAVKYPREAITSLFGNYFTNSISWMIAHAIVENATEIHIYGVDMATSGEYCVGPETRVLTADLRWVPASEIVAGDRVIAFDENSSPPEGGRYRRWREAIVESAAEITRPSYRVAMSDGSELVCSQEHRWLCHHRGRTEWVRTDELRAAGITGEQREALRVEYATATATGAYASGASRQTALANRLGVSQATVQRIVRGKATSRPLPATKIVKAVEPWETDESWGAGFLAAAFDGEGHISPNARGLGFAQRPNAMSDRVEHELTRRGFDYAHTEGRDGCRKYTIKGGRAAVLRFLGMMRPPRLLSKLAPAGDWGSFFGTMAAPAVTSLDYLGEQTVVALKTTTGTFIADGFASHNSSQRPSCEYFIGLATGMGIKVFVPQESDLCKVAFMYGAEDDGPLFAKLSSREKELRDRLGVLQQQQHQLLVQSSQVQGALEDVTYWRSVWTSPRANRDGSRKDGTPQEAPTAEVAA